MYSFTPFLSFVGPTALEANRKPKRTDAEKSLVVSRHLEGGEGELEGREESTVSELGEHLWRC